MRDHVLFAALAILLSLNGCASAPVAEEESLSLDMTARLLGAPEPLPAGSLSYDEIITSPPRFTWGAGGLGEPQTYCYIRGAGRESPFYVSENSFHYFDPENRLLRYDRTEEGFRLVEVKRRKGISITPECPVILPEASCTEEHYLLIAYVVECRQACTYRAVVFDSFSSIRIIPNDPALVQIMRHLENRSDVLKDGRIKITHEEYGILDGTRGSWRRYVVEMMGFIYEKVEQNVEVRVADS
ncbi:hypothetical protein ACFL2P_02540 [Candidatus Moduliflexota bacterium]